MKNAIVEELKTNLKNAQEPLTEIFDSWAQMFKEKRATKFSASNFYAWVKQNLSEESYKTIQSDLRRLWQSKIKSGEIIQTESKLFRFK